MAACLMVFVMLVLIMVFVIVVMLFTMVVVMIMSVFTFVLWCVSISVPVIRYEENFATAGIIFVAVSGPILVMVRRHAQIERRHFWSGRRRLNNHWLGINYRRRCCVAQIDLTVKARFADIY